MRKRNFKKLAALFIIAVYALSTFAFASAAEDDGIVFDFEDGVQGWTGVDAVDGEIGVTAIETTTEEVADGESSLKVT
ncbi:MAG: hypothetical protein WC097_07965, partial [Eubacteriales bacterium]